MFNVDSMLVKTPALTQASGTDGVLPSLIEHLAIVAPDLVDHGSRVNDHARRVIGLLPDAPPALAELTRITAALHDVGKLAISGKLLERPGPLSAIEYARVQRHAAIGANLLEAVAPDHPIVETVRHHHEWWNGAGYPAGLNGADIPLAARIVAVADAFDAMISGRPYRDSFSVIEALDELIRCAGTQFDPVIVEAMDEAAR